MKISFVLPLLIFASSSCSKDDEVVSDTINAVNGNNTSKRYMSELYINSDNETTLMKCNYSDDKLVSFQLEDEEVILEHQESNADENAVITSMMNDGEKLFTGEIISEVYDAYEIGEVLEYDRNGNPILLELIDDSSEQLTAEIAYDNKPFVFYNTLEAAGMINLLNDIRLQFSDKILLAKKLMPVNNAIRAVIKNSEDMEEVRLTLTYQYDEYNYPSTSILNVIEEDGDTESMSMTYLYK